MGVKRDKSASLALSGVVLFLVTILFVAPLVHEWFHLWMLDIAGCQEVSHEYNFDGLYGFSGIIEFECSNDETSIGYGIVYAAGYVGTLVVGVYILGVCLLLMLLGLHKEAILVSPVGSGFVLSSCTGFVQRDGELAVALSYLGLDCLKGFLPVIGFSLFLGCLAYLWMELMLAFRDVRGG